MFQYILQIMCLFFQFGLTKEMKCFHAWKSWKNQAEAVIHSMMEKIPKYKSSG